MFYTPLRATLTLQHAHIDSSGGLWLVCDGSGVDGRARMPRNPPLFNTLTCAGGLVACGGSGVDGRARMPRVVRGDSRGHRRLWDRPHGNSQLGFTTGDKVPPHCASLYSHTDHHTNRPPVPTTACNTTAPQCLTLLSQSQLCLNTGASVCHKRSVRHHSGADCTCRRALLSQHPSCWHRWSLSRGGCSSVRPNLSMRTLSGLYWVSQQSRYGLHAHATAIASHNNLFMRARQCL
jgi:hypothetical protein